MQSLLLKIDKVSTWIGQAFSWLILSLTLLISWEVFSRYVVNHPHPWAINEHSNITSDGPPIYPFKTVIPVAGIFVLLQGIVEIIRCVIAIKTGEWPSREQDVEEVDVDKLKAMVHVKDEDIEKLDQYVHAVTPGADMRRQLEEDKKREGDK